MPKQNQIIAIEKGVKVEVDRKFTDAHKLLQKQALLMGISRTYNPVDDEGDRLPPEETLLQVRVGDVIEDVTAALTRLFDVVATKEWGNTHASADIVVEGNVLAESVPVTYLLFLEKKLVDIHTFVSNLPVLDSSERWEYSENDNHYQTPPVETHRSKKVPRVLVKAPATDKHQADTEVYHEDVVVGHWTTVKFSGALPSSRVREMERRLTQLREAVKQAREVANGIEVNNQEVGNALLSFIFNG